MDFKNKNVAVFGFGQEGESVVNFMLGQKARVSVFDVRSEDKFDREQISRLKEKGVEFRFDKYPESFSGFDCVVRSPGISPLSQVFEKIKKEAIAVTSATKIFFDLCPAPIIGITGTKGKGTTSTLIYEMLKKQGIDAYLGGNIGLPPLEFLASLKSDSWVVLELSSFQLQDLTKSPKIALVLMVTSEHLDYHRDLKEYIDAKRNILRFQSRSDFAILNRDYPASNESDIHTADILLPGKHNFENACAASMAAYLAGVEIPNIASVLKEFRGLEHRLELVRIFNEVKYYDDSFSTTPETAVAAIEAFEEP